MNNLIKAENIYQTLDSVDARALIYQKYLLSDNEENKIKLLFTLKDLFQKDDLFEFDLFLYLYHQDSFSLMLRMNFHL